MADVVAKCLPESVDLDFDFGRRRRYTTFENSHVTGEVVPRSRIDVRIWRGDGSLQASANLSIR